MISSSNGLILVWFAELKCDLGKKAGWAVIVLWIISLFKLTDHVNKLVKGCIVAWT